MSIRYYSSFLLVVIPTAVWSQTAAQPRQAASSQTAVPAAVNSVADNPALEAAIAPHTPVITIAGICDKSADPSSSCTTLVTREEFERLAQVVQPGMTANDRQRFGALYSQLLVFANAAHKRGLDKSAEAQEALQFAQLQALSQILVRKLQADVSKVSADDIQKYYHMHQNQFEEATLLRLFVPRGSQSEGKSIKEGDAQAEMRKLRDRAVQGESFDSLQKQAYTDLGLTTAPPPTELKKVRRESLSLTMSSVFDLQLSALSEPISEPGGLYVLQMTSKRVLSQQEATAEIVRILQNRRLQQSLEDISASTKSSFNADYFGGAPKTAFATPGSNLGLAVPRETVASSTSAATKPVSVPKQE